MAERSTAVDEFSGPLAGLVSTGLGRAVRAQSGAARTYVRALREEHPEETPAQIRRRLDSRFLALVTATGTAVGATSTVPGVGTALALGALGVESLVFLEAAAFYTLAVAEVHGVDVSDAEQEKTLVMSLMLGASGTAILSTAVGGRVGSASGVSLAGRAMGLPSVTGLNRSLMSRFFKRYAAKRATLALGKLAPAGIGAAIGGWGNRKLGRVVVDTASSTFGPPPTTWLTP